MPEFEKRRIKKLGAVNKVTLLSLAVIFVLGAAIAIGTFVYLNQKQRQNLTRKIDELGSQEKRDENQGKERFALAVAKIKQEEALTALRQATNQLEELAARLVNLKGGTTQNVAGVARLVEVNAKLERLRHEIFQIESAARTPYMPERELFATVKETADWAGDQAKKVADLQSAATARSEQKTNVIALASATNAPVLKEGTTSSQPSSTPDQEKSAAERILAETKAEAERILAETRAEARRILEEARGETAKILAEARKTQQRSEEVSSVVETKPEISPLEKARLREIAADPKVRARLLPFTTPGQMRLPGVFRAEKAPLSLSQMQDFGALEPNMAGLQRLVEIAVTPQDAIRPRWNFGKDSMTAWKNSTNQIEEVRGIQTLLIQLGPELVEMGLLAR